MTRALQRSWGTLLVALVLGALAFSPTTSCYGEYTRGAIARGEWWRLWSGHFVHFGAWHCFWNIVVTLIAGLQVERRAPIWTRVFLALSPGLIGAMLFVTTPDLERFRGFSGVAAGLVAAWAALDYRDGKRSRATLVAGILALKITSDVFSSRLLLSAAENLDVVPSAAAHLAGVISAALLGIAWAGARIFVVKNQLHRVPTITVRKQASGSSDAPAPIHRSDCCSTPFK